MNCFSVSTLACKRNSQADPWWTPAPSTYRLSGPERRKNTSFCTKTRNEERLVVLVRAPQVSTWTADRGSSDTCTMQKITISCGWGPLGKPGFPYLEQPDLKRRPIPRPSLYSPDRDVHVATLDFSFLHIASNLWSASDFAWASDNGPAHQTVAKTVSPPHSAN